MKEIKTVFKEVSAETVVKKSRFLTTIVPVLSQEDANLMINDIKRRYPDASHHCFAYVIGTKNPIMKCNDDGEPSKTAGKPMLDILLSQELTDILVVVARYFGGTLLGTGGLVKAYQGAVIDALNQSILIKKQIGTKVLVKTDYNSIGKIRFYLEQEQITLFNTSYTDIVAIEVILLPNQIDIFIKKIAELTNGSAILNLGDTITFTSLDGQIIFF